MNFVVSLFVVIAILIAYVLQFDMVGFVYAWGVAGFFGYTLFALVLMKALGFETREIGKIALFLIGGFLGANFISVLALKALTGPAGMIFASIAAVSIGLILIILLWRKL